MDKGGAKQRNLESFGLKIKKYRKNARMTAEALARSLQVFVSSVRNWECGLSRPDPESLFKLFTVLRVEPNEFFGIRGIGAALSPGEQALLEDYRMMDSRAREDFRAIGEAMRRQCRHRALREVRGRLRSVPDYGRCAAAGSESGWEVRSEPCEVLLYNSGIVSQANEIITVSGHSMEPGFHNGDRVLVRYCTEAAWGKVCVFSLRGVGCVIKEAAPGRLHSQNRAYGDIVPWEEDGAELIGCVLGVIEDRMIPSPEEAVLYEEAVRMEKEEGDPE